MAASGEVTHELQELGTEQNRKIYRRHGVGENTFGVSYAHLGTLKKRIKQDHELALQLWETGNHDARILATMIVEPQRVDESLAESWIAEADNYIVADAVATMVSTTAFALPLMRRWIASGEEWTARAGWRLFTLLARQDHSLDDTFFASHLQQIEQQIHSTPNRVREAMNTALIAVGIRSPRLEALALAAAALWKAISSNTRPVPETRSSSTPPGRRSWRPHS